MSAAAAVILGIDVESAAAEISVLAAMLRREAKQPDAEEQFDAVLQVALARIDALVETILARLEDADPLTAPNPLTPQAIEFLDRHHATIRKHQRVQS